MKMFSFNKRLILSVIFILINVSNVISWRTNSDYYNYNNYPNSEEQYRTSTVYTEQSSCKCMKLKYCQPIIELLRLSATTSSTPSRHVTENLISYLKKITCGYQNNEPTICCPYESRSRRDNYGANEDSNYSEKPWVWDTDDTVSDGDSHLNSGEQDGYYQSYNNFNNKPYNLNSRMNYHNNQNNYNYNNNYNKYNPNHDNYNNYNYNNNNDFNFNSNNNKRRNFLAHFEDPRTLKNCPPSFSEEFIANNTIEGDSKIKTVFAPPPPPSPSAATGTVAGVASTPTRVPTPVSSSPAATNVPAAAITTTTPPPLVLATDAVTVSATTVVPTSPPAPATNLPATTVPIDTTTPAAAPTAPTAADAVRLANARSSFNGPLCGISVNTRIIGGENAGPGQFPWMARLAYRNRTSGLTSYRCAGSVINERYVVTAAHCVTNLIDDLEVVMVRLGETDANSDTDCNADSSICSPAPQDYEIDSIISHRDYDVPKYANDIALIRLRQSTNASNFISPLCLPVDSFARSASNLTGTMGIIAGWGSMTAGTARPSAILQWLRLPIVDTTECAGSYARFSANSRTPIVVSDRQICVQGTENMDACQGDSGGPLMSEGSVGLERYTLLGLVSFGPRTCGVSNFPGVYTRITSYIDWIMNNITM